MKYNLITTATGIEDACSKLFTVPAFGLDKETTHFNSRHGKLRLIQMSDGKDLNYIIDVFKLDNPDAIKLLIPLFSADRPRKVIHNAKFEIHWAQTVIGTEINGVFDTYLAHKMLDMRSDASLKESLLKYKGIELDKEEQRSDWSVPNLSVSQYEYAIRDAYHLPSLREMMIDDLVADDMIKTAAIEFNCTPSIAAMEHVGFGVNIPMYEKLCDHIEKQRDEKAVELQKYLNDAVGAKVVTTVQNTLFSEPEERVVGGVNLNSPAQVKAAFAAVGVELPSTGKQVINQMVGKHPQLRYLTDYRGAEKLVTSYGRNIIELLDPVTQRIHAAYWQLGAATGRFACRNPNLQQVPHDEIFRECFRPNDPNRRLVIADYSQIELCILAQITGDKTMIDAFRKGIDIHSLTAKNTYNLPCDVKDVKDQYPDQRKLAKALVFGIVYGMGAQKYSDNVGVTIKEAKHAISSFYNTYPQVAKWFTSIENSAISNRGVRTLAGRKIKFFFDSNDPIAVSMAKRNGRNTPIQGLSADILKIALNLVYNELKPYDASIVHIVHDEIIVETNKDDAKQVAHILSSNMRKAADMFITEFSVKADSDIGKSWADKS